MAAKKKTATDPARIVHVITPESNFATGQRCARCGKAIVSPDGVGFQPQAILETVTPTGSMFAIYTGLDEGDPCEAVAAD